MSKNLKEIIKKNLRVSVGISALNEEKNIKRVLLEILSQKQTNWKLREILVFCDGSSDSTPQAARAIKSKCLKVFDFKKRKGKTYRVNQILRAFKGDVLVIFDADIKLKDSHVINNLISEFMKDPEVMLVGGNSRTFPPKTFFQKAIFSSYYVYFKSREEINSGQNVFGCTGCCLAIRRKLAKRIHIPAGVMSEDSFIYFFCLKMGFKFRHAKKAVVYYKLAENLKDFLKQIFRTHPEAINLGYSDYFGELIQKEYRRPLGFYLKGIMEAFVANPIGTVYMIVLKLACKPLFPIFSKKYKLNWFTASSTK